MYLPIYLDNRPIPVVGLIKQSVKPSTRIDNIDKLVVVILPLSNLPIFIEF